MMDDVPMQEGHFNQLLNEVAHSNALVINASTLLPLVSDTASNQASILARPDASVISRKLGIIKMN